MPPSPLSDPPDAAAAALREIHELIATIARTGEGDATTEVFYDTLLENCVQATAAIGGAVWYQDADSGFFKTVRELNFPPTLFNDFKSEEAHAGQLAEVCRTGEPQSLPYSTTASDSGDAAHSPDYLLLLCPVPVDKDSKWIVELVLRRTISPSAQQGHLRFLSTVSEIAADFHRHAELRKLRGNEERWQELYRLSVDVHQGLSVDETAYAITNGSRPLLECDRVSVLQRRGGRCRLLSVSGVDQIESRSLSVRRLESLAEAAVATREPLWSTENGDPLPPQIERPLEDYLNEAHMRQLAVIPMFQDRESTDTNTVHAFAALVVEWKRANDLDDFARKRSLRVAHVCESALARALMLRGLPFSGWLLRRRKTTLATPRRWFKRLFFAAILITGLTLLGMLPRPFTVSGLGELQPRNEQRIFAVSDGEVDTLHVQHGDDCAAGDLLVTMTNSQLDFDLKQVGGELQTTRTRLTSVRAAYLGIDRSLTQSNQRYEELTAEEQELQEKIDSLNKQYEILLDQKQRLEIRSPLDGRVLTWDVEQLLQARPVRQGQALLTVANLNGPWRVELHVSEEDVGYLIAAQEELGAELPVSFLLESDPSVTYTGRLETTSLSTSFDEWDAAGMAVTIVIDEGQHIPLRPGARVRAKIAGGERSLAFVCLHDLYAAVQRWLLF
ncbi:Multidrug resistance protein MdtA [Symmachiella dynata]|uniref:HlyD family efflux transporter periplasmic adaptor subunit n=1 Tax=Symmachiella dynata TaxID=2527995 RepID=UPI0011885D82|nr:HlyD family efflux transporter periplasmic adaptor subunit [Symmachiella dynata]QDT49191.1 Multidrug resistance protein MdtA [Symmachiella dynata]